MIPIAKPLIGEEEKKAVLEVLSSGMLVSGARVKQFEQEFASYVGAKHAIASSSGTSALATALHAAGVGAGDEVITTPFSFVATANTILGAGAKPVFVDVREDSFNIDVEKIEEKITARTKAILPVHLYGNPCEMNEIIRVAQKHDLKIIEDCAQAHGAEYHGKKVGSFGTGAFSFYPTKNMTTGEGGMVTANDEVIAEKCRRYINHGQIKKYVHEEIGFNYRMTEIAAAIGLAQLQKLDGFNENRIENALYLSEKLKHVKGVVLPKARPHARHVFHQYTVRILEANRNRVADLMLGKGVQTAVHYPTPIHKQPLYQKLGFTDFLPVAETLSKQVLSLPVHPSLKKSDLDEVARVLQESVREAGA
jgi:dTDP-4-amino-4,6-dideoxygalactose transaminase